MDSTPTTKNAVILGNKRLLKAVNADIYDSHIDLELSAALATPAQIEAYHREAHLREMLHHYVLLAHTDAASLEDVDPEIYKPALASLEWSVHENQDFERNHEKHKPPALDTEEKEALQNAVTAAARELKSENIKDIVDKLAGYETRFYNAPTDHGYLKYIEAIANNAENATSRGVQVEPVRHDNIRQYSILVIVPGETSERVILGAHLDSTASDCCERDHVACQTNAVIRAPGADDNASGVAVLLEVYRAFLLQEKTRRTVEFHFYANEEHGMVGSQHVAEAAKDKRVVSYLNIDMALFPGSGAGNIYLATDSGSTSSRLNKYLFDLKMRYPDAVSATIKRTLCGGNSDNVSWRKVRVESAWVVEANCGAGQLFRLRHSANDRADHPNFDPAHAVKLAELAVAYALDRASIPL